MNKVAIAARHRNVAAALGSVRAEGLKPSAQTQKQLQHYAEGKISSRDLRSGVFTEVRSKAQKSK
jgi:hypothetical protein